ncbi:hypothetical protein ACP70R_020719 [Stipagrostis hirtigluma subsp. patula]
MSSSLLQPRGPAAVTEPPPDVPPEFLCPITLDLMRDPVVAPTGITYDRAGIEAWLLVRRACPVTHGELRAEDLVPNRNLRRLIQGWCAANRSRGVERMPSPRRAPATPAQAADAVAEVEAAASSGQAARCATAAREVRRLARAADRNRRCLASAGAARALAATFVFFADGASDADSDVLADVLAALVLVMPLDEAAIAAVASSSASVARLVAVAAHGDLHSRLQAVVAIRVVVSFARTSGIELSGNTDAIADVVVMTIRDAVCPQATKACLVAAHHLARADDRAAVRLAAAGIVPLLVELLVGADRSTAERALAALDAALASGDGRAHARADALAVPVLVKKMFRVSDTATEFAVSALWRICRKCPDDDEDGTRRLAVVEALQVGALQKLLLLLQIGCSEETKEKATALLRLMVKYPARVECIDTMDFRGLNRRDIEILIR